MSSNKTSLSQALTNFFSSLFHNLPKLLLSNLLFAVPFAVFFAIFWLINTLFNLHSMFILFLTAIPLFPFYAGITQVTSHMVRGEQEINVFDNFVSGVKDNFVRFLIHGVIFYFAIFFSYYSIVLYGKMAAQNSFMYVPLVLCIFISIFFLFVFFCSLLSPVTLSV